MSKDFDEVAAECAYTILPSCAEAGASSVVTTMHKGLIPVVPESASINLQDFGILIDDLSVAAVKRAMIEALNLDDNEIVNQRKKVIKYVNSNQTQDAYRKKLHEALTAIVGNKT